MTFELNSKEVAIIENALRHHADEIRTAAQSSDGPETEPFRQELPLVERLRERFEEAF